MSNGSPKASLGDMGSLLLDKEESIKRTIRRGAAASISKLLDATPMEVLSSWRPFLIYAASIGSNEALSKMLSAGVPPGGKVGEFAAAHAAAKSGNIEALQILHDSGASMETLDSSGWSPLRHAVFNRRDAAVLKLLSLGTTAGRDASAIISESASNLGLEALRALLGSTPSATLKEIDRNMSLVGSAMSVGRRDLAECLMGMGFGLHMGKNGATPITSTLWGQAGKKKQHIAWLLSKGASLNGGEGAAVLIAAAETKREALGIWLLKAGAAASASLSNADGYCPLHAAASNGLSRFVKELLEAGADPLRLDLGGETALFAAAEFGDAKTTRILLDAGCPADAFGRGGRTPLEAAAETNSIGATEGSFESAELIMARGGKPEEPSQGNPALRISIVNGDWRMVSAMIRNMIDRGVEAPIERMGLRTSISPKSRENGAEFERMWELAKLNAELKIGAASVSVSVKRRSAKA